MLLDIVLDALEILGFLTLFLTLAALIMAPGGPKGIMKLIRDPPVIPVIGFKQFVAWYGRILIPLSLIIAVIFLISAGGIINQMGTTDWAPTEATVIESEVLSETNCDPNKGIDDPDRCKTRVWLNVVYEYQFEIENYTSNRYHFLGDLDESREPDYPHGKILRVYTNPDDRSESVMVKGFAPVWDEILAGMFFIVMIAIFTTYGLVIWKIAYHIQPAANRAKAREAPDWEWKGLRELFASSRFAGDLNVLKEFHSVVKESTHDVYEGDIRHLTIDIDGSRKSHQIKSMNDILMLLETAEGHATIFLEESLEEGRSVTMDVIDAGGQGFIVSLTESMGSSSVRTARIDLDDSPLPLMEFIRTAVKNANQEQGTWWN